MMTTPTIGAIIIGDEILSGKRQDKHLHYLANSLAKRNLELKWVKVIGDDPELIISTLRQSFASQAIVFCFGGIGATPDDHTRQCVSVATGSPLVRHPDAVFEIEAQFGKEAYPKRILMADIPENSIIIPNPFNRIPGFSLMYHHFLPGFPQMAWPMVEWVLDNYYPNIAKGTDIIEKLLLVEDVMESQVLDLMQDFVKNNPNLKFSSLPSIVDFKNRRIEFGIKGDSQEVPQAFELFKNQIEKAGFKCQAKERIIE